jgi:hypothetical protein
MSPVNPTYPTVGGSWGTWGTELNAAVDQVADFANSLETALAGKAPTVHTHTTSDVTGLDAALAGKADAAATAAALAGKADSGHSHAASDLGLGAGMYRASTGAADTAAGVRTMIGYDTTLWASSGYTVDYGTGTITVPSAGLYLVEAHARFSAAYTGGSAAIVIGSGATELSRSTLIQSSVGGISDIQHIGTVYLAAGAALLAQIFTATSTSLVGNAAGVHYLFRAVRIG